MRTVMVDSESMSTSDIVIRRAGPADVDAVGRLGALLLRAHYGFDEQRFMRPGDDAAGGYAWFLGTQLDDPDCLLLVAERADQVIGYLYAGIEPRNWKELREEAGFVHDVLVIDEHRGAGVAEALMREAFAWMRERGVPRVLLWTAAPNERARRLFERLGFRPTMTEMTKEL
jgi:ribosomal protein S18 acetylase RimI-like enzyme